MDKIMDKLIEFWYFSIPAAIALLTGLYFLLRQSYYLQKYGKGKGKKTPEYITDKPKTVSAICKETIGRKGRAYRFARFYSTKTQIIDEEKKIFRYTYVIEYWEWYPCYRHGFFY